MSKVLLAGAVVRGWIQVPGETVALVVARRVREALTSALLEGQQSVPEGLDGPEKAFAGWARPRSVSHGESRPCSPPA